MVEALRPIGLILGVLGLEVSVSEVFGMFRAHYCDLPAAEWLRGSRNFRMSFNV